jgi:energy-coupling factor transporter transmembrane protein EcfT
MILTGLPLRDPIIVGALVLILLGVGVTSTGQTIGGRLLLAAAKIVCLTMLVGLFSMTTKISAVIQFLRPSNSIASTLEPLAYMINTTLAVFPSIQYDLQRALDAETIRRGRRVRIYSVGSWATILTVVLVRALNRAERFTDTVLDRGYVPSRGLQYIGSHSFRWQDGLWALICIVPGLIIWIAVS